MIKKLFILPILGVLSIGAFASADSDGYFIASCDDRLSYNGSLVSDNGFKICDIRDNNNGGAYVGKSLQYVGDAYTADSISSYNSCLLPIVASYSLPVSETVNSFSSCSSLLVGVPVPEPDPDPEEEESNSGLITIPSSFTSGLTSLVNNFGSTIVGRLPTILLVALGITAIFALFRVVRNYAKSAFKG